jgi:hypothetical protein
MTADVMGADFPIGAVGFLFYLAASSIILRQGTVSPAVAAVGTAVLVYAGAVVGASFSRNANFWIVSVAFWFPSLVFLMCFGAVYKSVSLRILLDLRARPGEMDRYSAVLARYVMTESFESRLHVMDENGLAIQTSSGYALTDKGRRLAKLASALQRLFAIERSG